MHEILKARVDDPLDVLELAPDDVLEGEPDTRSKILLHSPGDQSGGMTGIFSSEPGVVRSPLAAPETFHVVEGQARVQRSSGESVDLQAGDIAVLSPGDWTWTFKSHFRAVFVAGPSQHDAAPGTTDES